MLTGASCDSNFTVRFPIGRHDLAAHDLAALGEAAIAPGLSPPPLPATGPGRARPWRPTCGTARPSSPAAAPGPRASLRRGWRQAASASSAGHTAASPGLPPARAGQRDGHPVAMTTVDANRDRCRHLELFTFPSAAALWSGVDGAPRGAAGPLRPPLYGKSPGQENEFGAGAAGGERQRRLRPTQSEKALRERGDIARDRGRPPGRLVAGTGRMRREGPRRAPQTVWQGP